MFRRCAFALLFALAACSPAGDRAGSGGGGEDGWRIAPEGDLNSFFDCLREERVSLVSAHRGGPAPGYPENALETLGHTLSLFPAIPEIDVAQSTDGVLFLLHDDGLERTTTGAGDAAAKSWAEIEALFLEDGDGDKTAFAPPRFEDVLSWAKGRTILEIDFKKNARYEDAAAAIKDQRAEDRVILIAYTLAQAQKLHRLLPNTMISLNIASMSDLNRAVAAGIPSNRLIAFTGLENPDPHLFDALDGQGVETIFATLGGRDSIDEEIARSGDGERYAELARAGADIIATDRPAAANAALAAAGLAPRNGVCGVSRPEAGTAAAG